jgi:hypothetical protein
MKAKAPPLEAELFSLHPSAFRLQPFLLALLDRSFKGTL